VTCFPRKKQILRGVEYNMSGFHVFRGFFICIQGTIGLHSQQSRVVIPMDPLHQENFSMLTHFFNESATFFKVSTFIKNTLFSSHVSQKVILNINMLRI
jgi:hypothetical protein